MTERPTAIELTEAVREFLERDILGALDGRLAFHTRVAMNALGIVARELEHGPAHGAAQRSRIAALLHTHPDRDLDDLNRELAAAIRSGGLDNRIESVRTVVAANVDENLSVANPKYTR